MELKILFRTGAAACLVAAFASGCYEYPAPPAATLGETYTQRKQDCADELLEGITDLTLADAQRIAITNNPTYIAAHHAVMAARARYWQAWGAYSPTITADFSLSNSHRWTRNQVNSSGAYRTETFGTSVGATANLLVFDGLAREFAVKIAEHNYDYYQLIEADEARLMMRAVAYAYNSVLLAIENKRIALEDRDFQESSLRDTELKYQVGAVPLSDVLNFKIYMNQAESNLINADFEYETAIYALAVLMGYPEGTFPNELKFPSDFKTNFSDLPAVDVYLDTALANRPDLKGYREQVEVARYQSYQTWSAYSPTVNAYVSTAYSTSLSHYAGYSAGSRHSYSESPQLNYGLTADWVIFNGLIRENRIREYEAHLASAEYIAAGVWMEVVGEVRSAYANYVQAVKQTRLFEETRDLSAQQRDLVDEGYKAGNTELTRLNEAQRDLVEAETNLASSYINIQNAKAQLDAAVAANSIAYYENPDFVAPGEIRNTPVYPDSEFAYDHGDDLPRANPNDSFIPDAEGVSDLVQPGDRRSDIIHRVNQPPAASAATVSPAASSSAPPIPTDPTRPAGVQ